MAIIGAILGDIAGSPFEFKHSYMSLVTRREDCDLTLFDKHQNYYATDDTIMSIATMEALETDGDFAKSYRRYGNRYPDMTYGVRFRNWLENPHMPAYNSLGNGSAMRVAYCADKFEDLSDVTNAAQNSAIVTHNHPEGVEGAVVTATCIYMAKHGYSKDEILNYAISQYPSSDYRYGCDKPLSAYKNEVQYSETCMDSVPIAIRCFYESENFIDCCRKIISMPIDTDTICAIAGPMCEEFYGNCLGSKEADEEMVRKFLPDYLIEKLEEYGVFEQKGLDRE